MKLDVRRGRIRHHAREEAALIDADRKRSAPREDPLHADQQRPPPRIEVIVGRDRLGAAKQQSQLQVILQVFAHTRQVAHERNPELRKQWRRPDARQLQQLRTLQRARAQQHLALRAHRVQLAILSIFDTHCVRALEQHARGLRAGSHIEIGAPAHGPQVARRCTATQAIPGEELEIAHSLLHASIEIIGARDTQLRCAVDDRFDQLVPLADIRAGERAIGAMRGTGAAHVAFTANEIRQHVGPAPARVTRCRPLVVILALPAHVDQPVDR